MVHKDEVIPIVLVRVGEVIVGERQRDPDQAAIDRVASSMADTGLLHPIAITPHRVLVFGATRLAAARQLGWESIEAREFESAEDPEVRALMEWEENDARKDLTLEQQMSYKRKVVDPILKARAKAEQQRAALATNERRWGTPTSDHDTSRIAGGKFPQATNEVQSAGKVRDLLGEYLDVSGKTMAKFERLVDWSEDESLPEGLRDAAAEARERANILGKVDGEYKRVKALKDKLDQPQPSAEELEAIVEQRFVRGYSAFEQLLETHGAAEMGQLLTPGSLNGFRIVLEFAYEWLGRAEAASES